MVGLGTKLMDFIGSMGVIGLFEDVRYPIMIVVACILLYLGIKKGFEPLLLIPIGFGMLLTNLPFGGIYHSEIFMNNDGPGGTTLVNFAMLVKEGGLLDFLYLGIKFGIYPPLIFLGVGAMTDFSPLIANPQTFLLGAAAQFGIFTSFLGAVALGFSRPEAASIGIIGGADGPTAIYLTSQLAPWLLGSIAVAAYSYMALVPIIQPPIMRALTTKKERETVMDVLRPVSDNERILFPIIVTILVALILPSAVALIGCLMFGNLLFASGAVDRLTKTASNDLMNIVTIFLGLCVGATATAPAFFNLQTIKIMFLGLAAFAVGTASGVLLGKVMYVISGGKINPLIGSAGVSAVPMAARVSQMEGARANPRNYLLMHAMGPNVAGVIGSAVAAGVLLALYKGMAM